MVTPSSSFFILMVVLALVYVVVDNIVFLLLLLSQLYGKHKTLCNTKNGAITTECGQETFQVILNANLRTSMRTRLNRRNSMTTVLMIVGAKTLLYSDEIYVSP